MKSGVSQISGKSVLHEVKTVLTWERRVVWAGEEAHILKYVLTVCL